MLITYYHTLYKRNVSEITTGEIKFKDGKAFFYSMGRGQAIELEYVVSIEELD